MFCPFCKASSSNYLNDDCFDITARRLIVVKYLEKSPEQEYSNPISAFRTESVKLLVTYLGTPSKSTARVKYQLFLLALE